MSNYKYEYIWLDGNQEPQLRSKTKILTARIVVPQQLPIWFFDGSSTLQAEGNYSDCALLPVRMIPDPDRKDAFLVMCEVMEANGTFSHVTNTRGLVEDALGSTEDTYWFGFEQEYVLIDPHTNMPLGFPVNGYPAPQGPYYCSVGQGLAYGRRFVEAHLDACLDAGLTITGINAEVMVGQWEFQLLSCTARQAGDDLWLARYLLHRKAEEFGLKIDLSPKPVSGDWNGSGMHTNFSNKHMRENQDQQYFDAIFDAFEKKHAEHIAEYGLGNELRLTGKHETAAIDTFRVGVSDRGASIRIPQTTVANDYMGYLEDRRPAANADPYRVVACIVETMNENF